MDTAALARQLAELDKVATPGPWAEDDGNFFDEDGNILPFMGPYTGEEGSAYFERGEADSDMLIALRNNLPAILRALCVMAAVDMANIPMGLARAEDDLDRGANQLRQWINARADELLAECTGAKHD